MSIILGIPTLNRFDWLERCIASVRAGSVVPDRIKVIDNSCGACPPMDYVDIITPAYNLGVAASWNRIVQCCQEDDQLIISNDDILFAPDTIETLLSAAESHVDAGTVSAIDGQKFSLFYLNRRCYEAVGPFDAAFYPAYFEDNDYVQRMALANWQAISAVSNVKHGGSQTRQAMDETALARSHAQFIACARLFCAKWGALPNTPPLYDTPFGVGSL